MSVDRLQVFMHLPMATSDVSPSFVKQVQLACSMSIAHQQIAFDCTLAECLLVCPAETTCAQWTLDQPMEAVAIPVYCPGWLARAATVSSSCAWSAH